MMNGVDPPRMGALRDDPPMGAEPRTADHPDEGGLIHRAVETNEPAQGEPTRMMTASVPPLGADVRPGEESDFASLTASPPSPRRARGLQGSSSDQPHRAERTLAMEYSYEAAEGIAGVRWVARLTEFLRATTTRTSGLQGRVLEGLGLMGSQTANSATLPQRQQHRARKEGLVPRSACARSACQTEGRERLKVGGRFSSRGEKNVPRGQQGEGSGECSPGWAPSPRVGYPRILQHRPFELSKPFQDFLGIVV